MHASTGSIPRTNFELSPIYTVSAFALAQSETAEVAILFKEAAPASTRISVRTKSGGVDATVLTGAFGGGGHARAAGATVAAPLDEARRLVLAEAERLALAVSRPTTTEARMPRQPDAPGMHGVLVVAKPAGPTSHDVVALVRRLAATRRIGHGGTLDPFASGVLPLFLGGATRLVEYHLADDKAYRAAIRFGATSTTDDLDGELTPVAGAAPKRELVLAALAAFVGPQLQQPPAYSPPCRSGAGVRMRSLVPGRRWTCPRAMSS